MKLVMEVSFMESLSFQFMRSAVPEVLKWLRSV